MMMAKKKNSMDPKVQELFARRPVQAFYEVLFVTKPHLPDQVRHELEQRFEELINKYDGSVKAKIIWGKRVMAYKMGDSKEGYYIVFYAQMPTDKVAKFTQDLNRIPELMRYLVLRLEEMSLDNLKLLAKRAEVLE